MCAREVVWSKPGNSKVGEEVFICGICSSCMGAVLFLQELDCFILIPVRTGQGKYPGFSCRGQENIRIEGKSQTFATLQCQKGLSCPGKEFAMDIAEKAQGYVEVRGGKPTKLGIAGSNRFEALVQIH